MCLKVTEDKVLIASEDITCYKVMEFLGEHKAISWVMGETYQVPSKTMMTSFRPLLISDEDDYHVSCGYHSYMSPEEGVEDAISLIARALGVHTPSYDGKMDTLALYECTIPKGANYYIGTVNDGNCGGYVSNSIIINKKLEL